MTHPKVLEALRTALGPPSLQKPIKRKPLVGKEKGKGKKPKVLGAATSKGKARKGIQRSTEPVQRASAAPSRGRLARVPRSAINTTTLTQSETLRRTQEQKRLNNEAEERKHIQMEKMKQEKQRDKEMKQEQKEHIKRDKEEQAKLNRQEKEEEKQRKDLDNHRKKILDQSVASLKANGATAGEIRSYRLLEESRSVHGGIDYDLAADRKEAEDAELESAREQHVRAQAELLTQARQAHTYLQPQPSAHGMEVDANGNQSHPSDLMGDGICSYIPRHVKRIALYRPRLASIREANSF